MRPQLFICAALFLLALAPTLRAQTPEPIPDPPPQTSTLTVTTRLVSLDAIVRDARGNLVNTLNKDSFTLREDGHPVPIRYFNHDSDLPLTVGLLIDTSGSETEYFGDEALAGNQFLQNVIRPAPPAQTATPAPDAQQPDRAFVVRFDSQVLLLQAMTSSLPLLRNGLRLLDYKPDPLKGTHGGGTLLFDAIVNVCTKVIGKESGRRALIIMTDGDDNGSVNDLYTAIHSAQAAGVSVYSILYTREPPGYPSISSVHPSGIRIMQEISAATGGREFIVSRDGPIRKIYEAIEDDLRSQYRIGFTPSSAKPHSFHKLDLRATRGVPGGRSLSDGVSDPTLTVQSRTAYSTPE